MNQILATKTDNKKRKKPKMPGKSVSSDIAKVKKVFAIGLIIFGGCVIGTGSYSFPSFLAFFNCVILITLFLFSFEIIS